MQGIMVSDEPLLEIPGLVNNLEMIYFLRINQKEQSHGLYRG